MQKGKGPSATPGLGIPKQLVPPGLIPPQTSLIPICMPRHGQPNAMYTLLPGGSPQMIQMMHPQPQLKRGLNAWVRRSKNTKQDADAKTEDLYRRVRGILNKLTPQMFQTLTQQMLELEIETPERLEGVVDLIFEKAISEPGFSVAYANMCRCLVSKKVVFDGKDGMVTVTFRKILLNKCQKEFEKEKKDEVALHEKIDKLSNQGLLPEELAAKKAELQLKELKMRRRSRGNIRFIGELFKLKMLTENIMHECVAKLFQRNDEESFECLCELLFSTGKDMDHKKAKPQVDQYFHQINEIITLKKTSSRVRFMLQDVQDLRKMNWVLHREEPKTIDQIHKEAADEEKKTQMLIQQSKQMQKRDRESKRASPNPKTQLSAFGSFEEYMKRKTIAIIDEYLNIRDVTVATLCVKKMVSRGVLHVFVTATFNHTLEKRDVQRRDTGKLLHALLKDGVLTLPQYLKGLKKVLEFAEDIAIDVPLIYRYLGELIGPSILDAKLPLKQLTEAILQSFLTKRTGAKLLSEVLFAAIKNTSERDVSELWTRSGVSVQEYFSSPEEAEEFCKDKKLEFLLKTAGPGREGVSRQHSSQIQEELRDLILKRKARNEEVCTWIDQSVDKTARTEPLFIRALVTCVCEAAIKREDNVKCKCDVKLLRSRKSLLQVYIDGDLIRELHALYALQALDVQLEHPPEFLSSFFNCLYDEELISDDGFFKWESSEDPAEQKGKGLAKAYTQEFFRWLRSVQEESGEEISSSSDEAEEVFKDKPVDSEIISLGPGGRGGFGAWARGSSRGSGPASAGACSANTVAVTSPSGEQEGARPNSGAGRQDMRSPVSDRRDFEDERERALETANQQRGVPDPMNMKVDEVFQENAKLSELGSPADKPKQPQTVKKLKLPWSRKSERFKSLLAEVDRGQNSRQIGSLCFHAKTPIGKGAFGCVFAGVDSKDGREVAVKRIVKEQMSRPEDRREIENLVYLSDSEYVVRYLKCEENQDFLYIVLELMEGNLSELMDAKLHTKLEISLCRDVVNGLMFLHQKGVIHRDIKPGNILYKCTPRLTLKIADFGQSSRNEFSGKTTVMHSKAGTRCWMACELIKENVQHSKSSDMFACGLVMHYLLSEKKHPFGPEDEAGKGNPAIELETQQNIISDRVTVSEKLNHEARNLVRQLVNINKERRPSASEALRHPLFWSNQSKVAFLKEVGNQNEIGQPRHSRSSTPVEQDLEHAFRPQLATRSWDLEIPQVYSEMTSSRKSRTYVTTSAVDLVRMFRNAHSHAPELTESTRESILEKHVFFEKFPTLVIEVYKAVINGGWDKRKDIASVMETS